MKLRPLTICVLLVVPWLMPGRAASAAGATSESPGGAGSNASSGALVARFRFDAGAPLLAPAGVGADGSICVGTADGYIHSLSAEGKYRWSYSVHGAILHRPLYAGSLWYVATSAERIYAFTREGTLYWVFKPSSAIVSDLVADAAGLLYFVGADRFLYGVTAHGGVSVRAPFGDLKAGPSEGPDGAIWAENQAGSVLRAHGQELRRFAPEPNQSSTLARRIPCMTPTGMPGACKTSHSSSAPAPAARRPGSRSIRGC